MYNSSALKLIIKLSLTLFIFSACGDDDTAGPGSEENKPPVISNIPGRSIDQGGEFTSIDLDDFVADPDNIDDEITWTASSSSNLSITIINRVAEISVNDTSWFGKEGAKFTATDPDGLSDTDSVFFVVVGKLIGTWMAGKITTSYGSLTNPDSTDQFTYDMYFQFTLSINVNNTWTAVSVDYDDTVNTSGTWSVSGSNITIKESVEPDLVFDFSISGNNLTLTSSETTTGYTTYEATLYTKQ